MVIGGEFEVHESAAEADTTAEPFARLRLLVVREERGPYFGEARAA